mmetsp:Transcript_14868/g.44049  ORF Transcript_14868/g.44049 Transcript_14868/m.44049 type:complete len:217 (-) Transcript_14868:70-720(-)
MLARLPVLNRRIALPGRRARKGKPAAAGAFWGVPVKLTGPDESPDWDTTSTKRMGLPSGRCSSSKTNASVGCTTSPNSASSWRNRRGGVKTPCRCPSASFPAAHVASKSSTMPPNPASNASSRSSSRAGTWVGSSSMRSPQGTAPRRSSVPFPATRTLATVGAELRVNEVKQLMRWKSENARAREVTQCWKSGLDSGMLGRRDSKMSRRLWASTNS